ncbi:helix-turn-helix domain-containing protein [Radiobacillus kanasensis]|uniref:helix-turn-helix domain-containing protein n=1 Tax=Radiobacillus kanasensis TaxID=2844358 RepID=UPI001E6194A4|nr:helix-turn-helix domain-containing protein [Radiobacillus kanasensis]UFT97657.1 helix-turn-helix domain-containing protein [Radiobacillus kanasensis]
MLSAIILDSIHKMHTERSVSGIYHILVGKRSAQTLQDAHLFKVTGYFGISKKLSRKQFDQRLDQLVDHQYVSKHTATSSYMRYFLTDKGKRVVSKHGLRTILDKADGLTFEGMVEPFYQRLLLAIQTISNVHKGEKSFIPILDDPITNHWVKSFYSQKRSNIKEVTTSLYQELSFLLAQLPDREATIFVERLSGHREYGQSTEQLGDFYRLDVIDIQTIITIVTHHIMKQVQTSPFPVLQTFLDGLSSGTFLTQSAQRTKFFLDQGFSTEEIARRRRLKRNTIEDHIVEIVHSNPHISISTYISKEDRAVIRAAIEHEQTRRLRDLKQYLGEPYSYFQIRLVLALMESQ